MEDLGRARADSKICGSIYTGGDGGGERGAGGVCRGKSYQENHGGAASPLRGGRGGGMLVEGRSARSHLPRTVNGTGHTGPSEFCATSI